MLHRDATLSGHLGAAGIHDGYLKETIVEAGLSRNDLLLPPEELTGSQNGISLKFRA